MDPYVLWSGIFGWVPIAGPAIFYVRHRRKPKHPDLDYKRINQMEFDLGLGHSEYGAKGISLAELAEAKAVESDKAIREIEDQLHPKPKPSPAKAEEERIAKGILNTFAVPSHIMGTGTRGTPGHAHESAWREQIRQGYMDGAISGIPARFDYPNGDQTYTGPHGLSCPCEECFGEINRRTASIPDSATLYGSGDLVSDLRSTTRVGGRPLGTLRQQAAKAATYQALVEQGLPVPPDLAADIEAMKK